jgi:hypothetical protein
VSSDVVCSARFKKQNGSGYFSDISTAKVTVLLLSLIVTGYLAMLSAFWPTEGQIRQVYNEYKSQVLPLQPTWSAA